MKTIKISHGPPNGKQILATLWDREEHSDRDMEGGTSAAYLIWKCELYNKTRRLTPMKPTTKKVHKAGILEKIEHSKE